MHRIAGACTLLLLAVGCSVSDPPPENELGRLCTMQVSVSGSFAQTTPPPPDPVDGTPYVGCWPVGIWTFSVTPGMTDCESPPAPLPEYQFKIELKLVGDYEEQVRTYLTDPSVNYIVKVSQGGDGLCEGQLDLFSTDGLEVWTLKPELYMDNHIGGDGEYGLFKDDQWVYPDPSM